MKNISFLMAMAAAFLPSCMAMQTVSFTDSDYFSKVYEPVAGTKDQLYLKANTWMISAFNKAESAIQHSDKEEGVILGKYLMSGMLQSVGDASTIDTRVYAIIDIRVKDQKARIEIKPQSSWSYDPNGMTVYNYSKEEAIVDMNKLARSFYQALLKEESDF